MRGRGAAVVLALILLPGVASAQLYRWVDERGTVHYTEGLDSVPERYRSHARPLHFPKPRPAPEKQEAATAPSGSARIPFTPGSPILVNAKINGEGPITLVLDTGADRTTVAPAALTRLGVSTRDATRGELKSATGTVQVDVVRVTSVEVGEAKAGPLSIVAHDADVKGADGLLGRDFLDKFTVTIDSKEGIVTLTPK